MNMRGCYLAAALLLAPWAQAQQVIEADNVMPPAPSPDIVEDAAAEVVNDALASEPVVADDDASSENVALENIEMELVTRAIYQCMDRGRAVFADEENRSKYSQCVQIRAAHYQQAKSPSTSGSAAGSNSPCSGAVVYQGSTYVFNDQEPCPIPDAVFKSRKPIEANPEYYTQPTQ